MIVRVQKIGRRNWTWECHRCHVGDARNTWADAYREARAHITRLRFGFQRREVALCVPVPA